MADEFSFQFRITGPAGDPWQVHLPLSPVNVGRNPGAEIVLDHPDVAPYHAMINSLANKCQVMDLGSATGTFVDGQRLAPSAIVGVTPGAKITVGPFEMTCEQLAAPAPEKVIVQGGPARPTPAPAPAPQASSSEKTAAVSMLDLLADSPAPTGGNGKAQAERAAPSAPPAVPPIPAPPRPAKPAAPAPAASDEVDASNPLFRKKALEKLQSPEQLNELMAVTAPKGWLVLAALLALLAGAAVWAFVGTVETTVAGRGALVASDQAPQQLEAVLYLAPADAARLRNGMPVRVSPVTVRPEEYGMIVGEVAHVGVGPSSVAEIAGTLGNDALAQSLIASGALVEVRVALAEDADTATGYRWTSTTGPSVPLRRGTVATGNVVISQEKPIELVFSGER